jgi:hypothetical protein
MLPLLEMQPDDALSVEPPRTIVAAAKPIVILRIMMLTLRYFSEHPQPLGIKLRGF